MSKNILRVAGGYSRDVNFWLACCIYPQFVLSDKERSYHQCLHLSQVITHTLRMFSNNLQENNAEMVISIVLALLINVYSKEGLHINTE